MNMGSTYSEMLRKYMYANKINCELQKINIKICTSIGITTTIHTIQATTVLTSDI